MLFSYVYSTNLCFLSVLLANLHFYVCVCLSSMHHMYILCCAIFQAYFINFFFLANIYLQIWLFSKSSVILGLALTIPLMVACLSVAIPIWARNGYRFWIPQQEFASHGNNHQSPKKEVGTIKLNPFLFFIFIFWYLSVWMIDCATANVR